MDFTSKNYILMDLDGTITDSEEGIINSLKYTLNAYGISDYDEKLLNQFIGPPLIESCMKIFGFNEIKAREAVEKYREYFRETGIFENRLYDGIELLLKELAAAGKKLILATSKAEVFAVKILDHFNISQYFWDVVGSELDGSRIKKDEIIRYIIDNVGIRELSGAVMIGDREHDIIGAGKTGIDSIGVLYGYGSYEELHNAGATLIVSTVEELREAILTTK